jgi:hypothetical protein
MPLVPPVMIATLPSRMPISVVSSLYSESEVVDNDAPLTLDLGATE